MYSLDWPPKSLCSPVWPWTLNALPHSPRFWDYKVYATTPVFCHSTVNGDKEAKRLVCLGFQPFVSSLRGHQRVFLSQLLPLTHSFHRCGEPSFLVPSSSTSFKKWPRDYWFLTCQKTSNTLRRKEKTFLISFFQFHPPQTSFNGEINFKWLWREEQGKKETCLWKKSREFIGIRRSLWFREIKSRVVDPENYDWVECLLLFHIDIN